MTHFTNNIDVQFKRCGLPIRLKIKKAASLYTKEEAQVVLREIEAENNAIYEIFSFLDHKTLESFA